MGMVVPTFQRKVAEQDMPTVRVQNTAGADSFGAGIGAGLEKLGAGMEIRQDKIDTAALLTAENNIQTQTTNFLYKDLLQRKGSAAATADKDFEDYWKTTVPEARKGLSPKAQQAFDNRIADYKNQLVPKINAHVIAQNDVALQDALDGAVYSSALSFSQPGAYLDTAAADRMKRDLEQKTAATMVGRDPNAINAKASAAYNHVMVASLKSLYDQGDIDGAKKWLELYDKKVDPALTSPYVGLIKKKTEEISVNNEADTLLKENGYDLEKTLAAVKMQQPKKSSGIVPWEQTKALVAGNESSGYDDPYSAHNNDSGAHGKYQFMPGTWQGIMGDAEMTPENQEKAFETKYKPIFDKYGAGGVLVAVYAGDQNAEKWAKGQDLIGDNGQHYSADATQYSNGNAYPSVNQYVKNALGSVNIDAPIASAEHNNELEKQIRQRYAIHDQQVNINKSQELERVQNLIASTTDIAARSQIIKDSNLNDWQKMHLLDATTKRTASDPGARVQLEKLSYANSLTQKDVDNLAPLLTNEHYIHYSIEAAKVGSGQSDRESKAADQKWDAFMDAEGPYNTSGDAKKNNELKAEINDRLNSEKLKGYARYDRAIELIANERKNKGQVIHFTQNNNLQRQSIIGDFGEKLVSLAEQGLKRSGDWTGDYYDVNVLLSNIGKQIETDPKAQEAVDLLLRNNIIINNQTWNDAYQEVTRQ